MPLHFTETLTLIFPTSIPNTTLLQAPPLAAAQLRRLIALQFQSGGILGGTPWADLKRGGPSFLYRSGALYRSLTDPTDTNAIDEPGPAPGTWRIGTRLTYARAHQFGTRTTPARPIVTPLMQRGSSLLGGSPLEIQL